MKSGIVYKLTCSCGSSYISQTRRNLLSRTKEHAIQKNLNSRELYYSNNTHSGVRQKFSKGTVKEKKVFKVYIKMNLQKNVFAKIKAKFSKVNQIFQIKIMSFCWALTLLPEFRSFPQNTHFKLCFELSFK